MAWSGSPITVRPVPSPASSRSSVYCAASMSWYSSTLIRGQRSRSRAATAGAPSSTATASSIRPSKSTRSRAARPWRSSSRRCGSAAAPASRARPPRGDPASSVATSSTACSSATVKSAASPASSCCSRKIISPSPWNVVTVSPAAARGRAGPPAARASPPRPGG